MTGRGGHSTMCHQCFNTDFFFKLPMVVGVWLRCKMLEFSTHMTVLMFWLFFLSLTYRRNESRLSSLLSLFDHRKHAVVFSLLCSWLYVFASWYRSNWAAPTSQLCLSWTLIRDYNRSKSRLHPHSMCISSILALLTYTISSINIHSIQVSAGFQPFGDNATCSEVTGVKKVAMLLNPQALIHFMPSSESLKRHSPWSKHH